MPDNNGMITASRRCINTDRERCNIAAAEQIVYAKEGIAGVHQRAWTPGVSVSAANCPERICQPTREIVIAEFAFRHVEISENEDSLPALDELISNGANLPYLLVAQSGIVEDRRRDD